MGFGAKMVSKMLPRKRSTNQGFGGKIAPTVPCRPNGPQDPIYEDFCNILGGFLVDWCDFLVDSLTPFSKNLGLVRGWIVTGFWMDCGWAVDGLWMDGG